MNLEFTGKLLVKGETKQVTEKFRKREFVLVKSETVGQSEFTDYIKFQLTQDKVSIIENINIGSELKVVFNLRGNKWEKDGKVNYFTNLEAWKIEVIVNNEMPPPPGEEDDSLPF